MAQDVVPDRVHPGPGGHLLMAEALLRAWNAPATVTAVEIDAVNARVVHAENTTVTGLKNSSGLSWTQADHALPMSIDMNDPAVALAMRSSDFVEALDQQPLKVTGLTGSQYALKIDGEQVGSFSKEQLEEGINLAVLPTPMAKQAAVVHGLTVKHNDVHFARWREVQVPLEDQHLLQLQAVENAMDKLESEVIQKQRATAQPKPRHYELLPQQIDDCKFVDHVS